MLGINPRVVITLKCAFTTQFVCFLHTLLFKTMLEFIRDTSNEVVLASVSEKKQNNNFGLSIFN